MTRCDRPGCDGIVGPTGFCDLRGHRRTSDAAPPVTTTTAPTVITAETAPAPSPPTLTRALHSSDSEPITSPTTSPTARAERRATRQLFTVAPAGEGLIDLPLVDLPSPAALVDPIDPVDPVGAPRAPGRGRRCGWKGCRRTVGEPHGDQPGLVKGFCPDCAHPFDFTPQLVRGDELGQQYRVVGCLAYGGNGWVYLATQQALDDRPVAIKGLINPYDDRALMEVVAERRNLTALTHPNIVRIISYETRPTRDSETLAGYIVMDFVPGMSLDQIRDLIEDGDPASPFGGPRLYEHIVAYGCLILDALEYMHGEELLYCDMKPRNVVHHKGQISVIDLGGVRRFDDRTSPLTGTPGFTAPEVKARGAAGLSERSDLYSVGRTLQSLSGRSKRPPPGLAAESYRRAIARATAHDPRERFASAREMAEQLRGVLREIRSLRTERELPEPSTLFAPTVRLLDAGIGEPPPLEHWLSLGNMSPPHPAHGVLAHPARGVLAHPARGVLAHGLPAPREVPLALPEPFPAPADPGAALLRTPTSSGLRRQLEQLSAFTSDPPSAEIPLRQCRIHLELGELASATARLAEAAAVMGAADAPYDWRVSWHRGLIRLAEGDVDGAQGEFERVYEALPGEYAPKLALGYCAEHRADTAAAERFYQAVWQRNRSQGSAAFGLVRLRIAVGDRAGAVAVLDRVPEISRHYDAARVAAARILVGRLGSGGGSDPGRQAIQLPTAADFGRFLERRPYLRLAKESKAYERARWRLDAEALDTALDWVRSRDAAAAGPGEARANAPGQEPDAEARARAEALARRLATALSGAPSGRKRRGRERLGAYDTLRDKLAVVLAGIAQQAPDLDTLGELVDLANVVAPVSRF